ncbi:MAG: 7-carboxy-7-deazaguanine synthase [Deltaproteobacteria bacterium]|nr:7-carboxy-7-deazaguanine synthase [Deltaproteobacteria bacterium]
MGYTVKEIFYTLQGEGAQTGRPAVFCRFAGCNLWSGREEDRREADCAICDTDFTGFDGPGGGRFATPEELARAIQHAWPQDPENRGRPLVVLTGGEPTLQADGPLIKALRQAGFETAMESNGTLNAPPGLDWITISPKPGQPLKQTWGRELKLVYPQPGLDPADYTGLDFDCFFLQPLDNSRREENTQQAAAYCLAHPQWRLCLQTHKLVGLR